ncbi:hypothetical protein MLD38_023103 [Melastoma candidum]|uniref:Uncharacterized protein n=1 Tax=Melastoma candidum TaxID=119954 RepID=A0ACB9QUL7_9MYRT|nr:hypothetical protein MLD38_023103 [Melastoma candidum]
MIHVSFPDHLWDVPRRSSRNAIALEHSEVQGTSLFSFLKRPEELDGFTLDNACKKNWKVKMENRGGSAKVALIPWKKNLFSLPVLAIVVNIFMFHFALLIRLDRASHLQNIGQGRLLFFGGARALCPRQTCICHEPYGQQPEVCRNSDESFIGVDLTVRRFSTGERIFD